MKIHLKIILTHCKYNMMCSEKIRVKIHFKKKCFHTHCKCNMWSGSEKIRVKIHVYIVFHLYAYQVILIL
jgi:hypothetical protein